jgi:OOP family OmpA-OmpF porin
MGFLKYRRYAKLAVVPVALLAGCATKDLSSVKGTTATAAGAPVDSKSSSSDEAAIVAANKVEIFFPPGGSVLTPDANKQLDLAARLYRDAHPVTMFTTGYADVSGDEFHNLLLSAQRAEAVKRGLVARGIPANLLLIQALGESELANTADPLSAANRRVTITWRLL